jgi:hypothetical protein
MDQIFEKLICRLIYDSKKIVEQTLEPTPNNNGETYLDTKIKDWILEHNGVITSDQEIVMGGDFFELESGPAVLRLAANPSGRGEVILDEWSCLISNFNTFEDHLRWDESYITDFIDRNGRHKQSPPSVSGRPGRPSGIPTSNSYKIPPEAWVLSKRLQQSIRPLGSDTSQHFIQFAMGTEVCFNSNQSDSLAGINDTVTQTNIEAVVNRNGRPFALWLRTPEPVDWRRVTGSARILHARKTDNLHYRYEQWHPLNIRKIGIIPSADGTSAFLIGMLRDKPIYLPMGLCLLKLRFETEIPGLPPLRPTFDEGNVVETVKYKFFQPFGETWPY